MNGLQRRIPRICTLSGNLACIDKPKERKERKKVVRQELGAQSEPENIADANTPTEITDKIIQLRKIVNRLYKNNGRKPLSFYNLVLHPESFKQTLENIFYMSFSLSEGYFSFTIGIFWFLFVFE